MNDFTKEELEDIHRAVYLCDKVGYEVNASDILPKIQSMIDNYCEHEPSDAHYEQFRWQLCSKCGVRYK